MRSLIANPCLVARYEKPVCAVAAQYGQARAEWATKRLPELKKNVPLIPIVQRFLHSGYIHMHVSGMEDRD